MGKFNPKNQYLLKNIRDNDSIVLKLNGPEFLCNGFGYVGILPFGDIGHFPILQEMGFENKFSFEIHTRHKFLQQRLIFNFVAAVMPPNIDKGIGKPSRRKQHNRINFLLIERRNDNQRSHPHTSLLITKYLLHQLSDTVFLDVPLVGQQRSLDC